MLCSDEPKKSAAKPTISQMRTKSTPKRDQVSSVSQGIGCRPSDCSKTSIGPAVESKRTLNTMEMATIETTVGSKYSTSTILRPQTRGRFQSTAMTNPRKRPMGTDNQTNAVAWRAIQK